MSATLPVEHTDTSDAGTRQRVLQLVASAGPVSAAELAAQLDLAPAGIRRHLGVLEDSNQIAVHDAGSVSAPKGRGRPARHYVVTAHGQDALSHRYSDLATQALRFLAETAGPQAVLGFAELRVREIEERHGAAVRAAGDDVAERVRVLADGLAADGYAASARPAPGGTAMQLCQGHCPVQDVAHEFPQLCEAEARAFSRMLGVHVQRLATLAGGGHVCTTHIPVSTAPHQIVLSVEGHPA
ncbi:metalloregulator ArsR/SmtB family transcription factor [Cellulomonas sp. URHD0024]|uniref:helix-turn-helix transcriptional regulator n=1 Tax=Cellulomonas sp. URHD0024 TaxID=1302620 RepID=UPI0003FD66AD|nr:helix-turn-helix domain-containing protein [Cellulomonas sp. URHD0024]